ncbi:hypothetical protein [Mycobacterium asiaticum]|uniref:Uncharacterized protein n=1 Tax=Mycobacterium asiaticum TaxID=1790 RepID=A0A1A3NX37_MYCAS|nr:hypothetical protein [Mycobacterium asiaticum]OBK25579.1 hypothetical protein A5635_15590 [Mycobacterium asiaticum]
MDEDAIRNVSRGLFGNKHKLEIIAAIAEVIAEGESDFYPRRISKLVPEAADNQVGSVIEQLRSGGLLIPVTDKVDLQKHRFRARDSGIWELAQSLLSELAAASWDPPEGD